MNEAKRLLITSGKLIYKKVKCKEAKTFDPAILKSLAMVKDDRPLRAADTRTLNIRASSQVRSSPAH